MTIDDSLVLGDVVEAAWGVAVATQLNMGGIIICTSSTRPSHSNGRQIYETDTYRRLESDGTGWTIMSEPIQTSTSSFTTSGITVGSGAYYTEYARSNGWCELYQQFTLGSGSGITGDVQFTLPIAMADVDREMNRFNVLLHDVGTREFKGMATAIGASVVACRALLLGGTSSLYVGMVNCSSTIPHTWASPDRIVLAGRYRMTTRYS